MKKHYPKTYKEILQKYPATGPSGLRRALGEKDPEYFCRAYLPELFDRDFGDYAREILETERAAIESQAQTNTAVVAPREHGKSTLSSCALPAWAAVYEKKGFILFISANGDTSANFLRKVKKAFESKEIIEDFGNLKGPVWNNDEIQTSTGIWIACTGWKSGIRGLNKDTRPDLIILDDLEDKATMESESLQRKLETCFREEIGRLGYYKTDFFYIGTLLSDDSLLARVIMDPSWRVLFFKCVNGFPEREDLWEQWRAIYRDIENDHRFDDAYSFYLDNKDEMLRGVDVLWPGRFPDEKMAYKGAYYNIMLNREKWGEEAFWKEDQNEPRSTKDKKFPVLKYWNNLPTDRMPLKLAVDPSEGKSDNAAYSLGGTYKSGFIVVDGQLRKHNPNQIIDTIADYVYHYPQIEEIIIETNLFRDLLQIQLVAELRKRKLYRSIFGIRNTQNKFNRIIQIEPLINGGPILFNPLNVAYNNEIMDFSKTCKHDDAPDSLEMLISRLKATLYSSRPPITVGYGASYWGG
jgi:predicted phage terminase large subunit-like protein